MKQSLIFIFLLTLALNAVSQDSKDQQIDAFGMVFINDVFRFQSVDGAGHVDNGEGYSLGLEYSKRITGKIWINFGFSYLKVSNLYHEAIINPMEPQGTYKQQTKLLQFPLRIRYDILKWLNMKSGLTIDQQLNHKEGRCIDNQSGIGFSLVGGVNLISNDAFILNLEPQLGLTSLIPFERTTFQQHFLTTGIRLNMGYRF